MHVADNLGLGPQCTMMFSENSKPAGKTSAGRDTWQSLPRSSSISCCFVMRLSSQRISYRRGLECCFDLSQDVVPEFD